MELAIFLPITPQSSYGRVANQDTMTISGPTKFITDEIDRFRITTQADRAIQSDH
jgi:hypothetical protein